MEKKIDTRNRARIDILNHIICFGTCNEYGEGKAVPAFYDDKYAFTSDFRSEDYVNGDLIKIGSAGFSKYYLSWYVEKRDTNGFTEHLLQSIEDGSLCWWSNVSLSRFNRGTVANNEKWKWTDAQFEFYDKVLRCKKRSGTYERFAGITFNEDCSVEIRKRGSFEDYKGKHILVPNWKKAKLKEIVEFFKDK